MKTKTLQGKYLSDFVYGAIDGTITTFAIVTGSIGAALSPVIILILGIANVLADGFSMGSSSYLAYSSENDLDWSDHKKKLRTPLASAIVTFISFVSVGSIPLLPFILTALAPSLWRIPLDYRLY